MTAWVEVLVALADGPSETVTGMVRAYQRPGHSEHSHYASHQRDPMVLGLGAEPMRMIRSGAGLRIETPEGTPLILSDGHTLWDFRSDPERPRRTGRYEAHFLGQGEDLLFTPRQRRWAGQRFSRPAGPVEDLECQGMRCWAVELASGREDVPGRRLIVGADRGVVLAQHRPDGASGAVLEDVAFGGVVDPAIFTWAGPVVTDSDADSADWKAERAREEKQREWFRDNVSDIPLAAPLVIDMTMRGIVITDSAKGEFSASLGASREGDGTAYLRRRVRSAEPWELDRGVGTPHVWSTAGFDWMCGVFLGTLEPDGLARLQRQLHPGEPVVGAPTVVIPAN